MKYLLPLLFLVGCESFPEEIEEPHFMEQTTERDTWVDDTIKDGIKVEPKSQIDYMSRYTMVEIDVSFFTHRRYMVYLTVERR